MQEYVRRLGINAGDEIVIYSRGPFGGVLHAARVWELFRVGCRGGLALFVEAH